jgi:hypothetical protein
MDPRAVRNVTRATRKVDGWFSPGAASLFALLDEAQAGAGVRGDLFEIGVHHGKSAVLLSHLSRPGETVKICDVFGQQELNESGSGEGERPVFEANYRALGRGDQPEIFEKFSFDLTPEEIGGPFRFFHVDGGHLAEEALADIELAASVLDERGVIVVDDPFHPGWPGVTEAIIDFCRKRPEYVPLVLGFNKLVLVRTDAREIYVSALSARQWEYFDPHVYLRKDLPIAGTPAAIYFIPSTRQVSSHFEPAIARTRWLVGGITKRLQRR